MKKLHGLFYFFAYAAAQAQTSIQQSSAPIAEPSKKNIWDMIALTAGSITFSALAFYLIYLLISGKKFALKRKLK